MNAYDLRDVVFAYGPEPVLQVPQFAVPSGAITALSGPNGCGKTTLLHLLAFLAVPLRGTVRLFGEPVTRAGLPGCRRRVSVLLQHPYLFRRSVAANVVWGLKLRGENAAAREARVRAALERVGLSGFEGRSAGELSGGEAQRVALARLLVLEPEVLLLDEPTSHLDADTRARVEEVLGEWVEERRRTVVLATHDEAQAHRLGARVWQMDGGRLRPGEADNVYRGRVADAAAGMFESGGVHLHVHPLPEGTRGVAIGPREVVVSRQDYPSSARNHFRGVIRNAAVSPTGEVRLSVDCGIAVVAVVTALSWKELGLTVGDAAVVSFKATSVRAF